MRTRRLDCHFGSPIFSETWPKVMICSVKEGKMSGQNYERRIILFCSNQHREGDIAPIFHPEFGRFMLETTPGRPWGIDLQDLLDVERDMRIR